MKWMIASDIHGSAYWCRKMLERYDREGADRLLLLGDILYHGPRNDLPLEYAPKEVLKLLNERKKHLFCVRGNCDTEVDQMVLEFPVLAEYCLIPHGNRMIFATHGHIHHLEALPPLQEGDVLLHGHMHVPACVQQQGILYLNPGSVSIPKEQSANSYMIFEDGVFHWKDIESGTIYMEKVL